MPADPARIKDLFVAVIDLADSKDRQDFLSRECGTDIELRHRLDALLAAHDDPHAAVKQPIASPLKQEATEGYAGSSGKEQDAKLGAIIAGKYKLLQQLGEGGMGSVYMADQLEPVKRRVAVKLIRPGMDSKGVLARFEAERQALALMDHPHIAKVLDAGEDPLTPSPSPHRGEGRHGGRPYFVMELVKGKPINEYCDEHKLPMADRLQLFMQVCSAVQHAHQKGIIHRDLKPSNILVESHDGKPVPKVIDFGLAKAMSGQPLTEQTLFTQLGTVAGTPLYMAPEQAAFNAIDVDTRADIYALGVVLYELLTGTTPIERAQLKKAAFDEILRVIRESEPPTPSKRLSTSESKPSVAANRLTEPQKLGRYVKGELDWIVMKALSKERDRRYETANGFAKDVERFLNHEAVLAGPVSAAYRLRKFVARNKGKVVAAGLVFAAILLGMAGTIWGWQEAVQHQRMAQQAAVAERQAKLSAEQDKSRAEASEKLASHRLIQVAAEKKIADEEKQIAQAVKDFLHHRLLAQADATAQADASLSDGEFSIVAKFNPTIRELLDRTALELAPDKIETHFPKQPKVQAEILQTIGTTYNRIGEPQTAIVFLTRSETLFRQHFGPDSAGLLSCTNDLALAYDDAGKLDVALPMYEKILKIRKANYGSDHADTLTSMNNLAMAYLDSGKLDLALPMLEEILKFRKEKFGSDQPETLRSMNNLAFGYVIKGKHDKALLLYEETLARKETILGPNHPSTLNTMGYLAKSYLSNGKLDKALPMQELVLARFKAMSGPDHPMTLINMGNLGMGYQALGQFDKALPLLEESLRIMKIKLGPDHPSTLSGMDKLASGYYGAGQFDKALPLLEETLTRATTKLGPENPRTLHYMANLGACYEATGKIDKALPLLQETMSRTKAKLGPDHPATLLVMLNLTAAYDRANQFEKAEVLHRERLPFVKSGGNSTEYATSLALLGSNLQRQKKWADAEPLLRECLAIREKTQPNSWGTFNIQSMIGGSLLGQKKYVEAEPLLLKGYEGMKAREQTIPPQGATRIPEALDRLIQLYTETNKPDEVKKWQGEKGKLPKPTEKK